MAHDHFQTPPDPQRAFTIQFESYFWMFVTENVSMIWNVTLLSQNVTGTYLAASIANIAIGCNLSRVAITRQL